MASITTLFSSSKANCTLIRLGGANILVDLGASLKATAEALLSLGIEPNNIDAIFITHEHSDHIKGLKAFTGKFTVPVYSSQKTLEELHNAGLFGKLANVNVINNETYVKDIKIKRFSVSHDSVDCGGFVVETANQKVAVCTDTGILTHEIKENLLGCKAVVIESNHDLKMLNGGPYPPELKLRIAGESGHLSNNACAAFLPKLLNSGTDRFILAHLSENNNTPLLAVSAATAALMDIGAKKDSDYLLGAAMPKGGVSQYF